MAENKNLGQVSGIYIATTPPENIKMVWWDSTSSQQCHKVYDYNLKQWVILNQGILSSITYSELRNIALTSGLSVGKFFVVSDKGNVLALSITTTKVQYVDISGNLLVDDLGSSVQYYVSSDNLTIDDLEGVFSEEKTKLNFSFEESSPDLNTAFLFGKDRISPTSSIMRLVKFKLSSIISSVNGNALKWDSGLYLNFNKTLLDLGDKEGGVTLFDTFNKDKEIQDQSIENIANNYNALVSQVNSLITQEISDAKIYSKKVTSLETSGEPIDVASGDTLFTALSKFQRYINKFKLATGINISKNFKEAEEGAYINNNDTVESAFSKVQYWLKNIYSTLSLSKDFEPAVDPAPDVPIAQCAPDDSIEKAVSILQGVLNDIGVITDGKIKSTQQAVDSEGNERGSRTEIDLKNGSFVVRANGSSEADVNISPSTGFRLSNSGKTSYLSLNGLFTNGGGQSNGYPYNGKASANIYMSGDYGSDFPGLGNWISGLYAWSNNSSTASYPHASYGAYIEKLYASGIVLNCVQLNDGDSGLTLSNLNCYLSCYNVTADILINLPPSPQQGQCVWIRQVNENGCIINGNGKNIVRDLNEAGGSPSIGVKNRGILCFLCFDGQFWMMNVQNNS